MGFCRMPLSSFTDSCLMQAISHQPVSSSLRKTLALSHKFFGNRALNDHFSSVRMKREKESIRIIMFFFPHIAASFAAGHKSQPNLCLHRLFPAPAILIRKQVVVSFPPDRKRKQASEVVANEYSASGLDIKNAGSPQSRRKGIAC